MVKVRCIGLFIVLFAATGVIAQAQEDKKLEMQRSMEKLRKMDPEYDEAMKLFSRHRHFEAQPLLEKLAARYPTDPVSKECLGISLIMTNVTVQDASARKSQRARGRKLLIQARELGLEGELNTYYISTIPEDGGEDTVFSNHKEANDAMKEGEAAFARHDYKTAIAAYTKAMMADPNLYPAVLFIGDSYFADKKYDTAIEWFERATRVNFNIETAYRYWGDALMAMGKRDEARTKFVEAIVAEPYNRRSWVGLQQWAKSSQVELTVPDIKAPKRPEVSAEKEGATRIEVDAGIMSPEAEKNGTGAWMMYQISAGVWPATLFKEKFPNEKQYRHSLVEETELLSDVAKNVEKDIEKGKLETDKLDSGIAMLLKLYKAKMLEPFILLTRADKGLAQDYPGYRATNREKLRQFLDEYVAPKIPKIE